MAAQAALVVGPSVLTLSAGAADNARRRNAPVVSAWAGLRPLSLRRVRGPAAAGAVQRGGRKYKGARALFGRGSGGSETKKDEKKFITKEEEPEQYWMTDDEKEGKNPMTTPLPYILMLSVLSPFAILAVAFANNWIKVPVR